MIQDQVGRLKGQKYVTGSEVLHHILMINWQKATVTWFRKRWNISSPSEFWKDVVGNSDPADGEGKINSQKVSDLKAVKNIYDRVQAVKVAAQVEMLL